jgi:hypothetical protein
VIDFAGAGLGLQHGSVRLVRSNAGWESIARDLIEIAEPMSQLGWIYRGDAGDDGGWVFVMEDAPWHRVAHAHGVELAAPSGSGSSSSASYCVRVQRLGEPTKQQRNDSRQNILMAETAIRRARPQPFSACSQVRSRTAVEVCCGAPNAGRGSHRPRAGTSGRVPLIPLASFSPRKILRLHPRGSLEGLRT